MKNIFNINIGKKKNDKKKNDKNPGVLFGQVDQKTLHKNLSFTATEQYKLLRTNIEYTLPQDEKCHVVGVTSSMRGEGKSTTAINLSYVLAEKGSKVLIIDGDLRIPSVAKKLQIKSKPGLTNLLMTKSSDVEGFKSELLDNWYIIPAGDIPPNPSELLGSNRMGKLLDALKEQFDYIIIDLPPVNIVSDALSVSPFISGMVVVIREEYTEKKELTDCIRQLGIVNVKILGCVLNEARSGNGSYSKYKYRKRRYGYGSGSGYGYGYGYGYGHYYKTHRDDSDDDSNNKENDK